MDELEKRLLVELESGDKTVEELLRSVDAPLHLAASALHNLRKEGKVIILDPSPPENFARYLLSSRSAWLWALVTTLLLSVASIHFNLPLRPILGAVIVIYLPGASLVELLYPKEDDLSQLERLALSLGLSLALTPLVGLILNFTPWGIRLEPVVTALSLLTSLMALAAAYRKYEIHLLKSYASPEKK